MEHNNSHPDLHCTVGLMNDEVETLKQKGLINKLDSTITRSNGEIVRSNLFTLFNGFNIFIGFALVSVGAYRNLFYLAIVGMNVAVSMIQELHAKKLVENLSLLSAKHATVIRNSEALDIPTEDIVLGDRSITFLNLHNLKYNFYLWIMNHKLCFLY